MVHIHIRVFGGGKINRVAWLGPPDFFHNHLTNSILVTPPLPLYGSFPKKGIYIHLHFLSSPSVPCSLKRGLLNLYTWPQSLSSPPMMSTLLNQFNRQFLILLLFDLLPIFDSLLWKKFLLRISGTALSFGPSISLTAPSQSPLWIPPLLLHLVTQSASGSRKASPGSYSVSCYRVSKSSYLSLLHLFSLQ